MKHENNQPGEAHRQHKWSRERGYYEDKEFAPSEYPKYVDGQVVNAPPAEEKKEE